MSLVKEKAGAITFGLVGFLFLVELVSGILQGFYVPLIPDLVDHLGIKDADFNWFEAAQLLLSAIVVPILAKCGDMFGHKRILLIGGEVVPFALARIPMSGETRGNMAAGGRPEARPLSADDRRIAVTMAKRLSAEGLFLVGLDVIGDKVTEINVTSPTGFVEITRQTGFDVAAMFIRNLESALQR